MGDTLDFTPGKDAEQYRRLHLSGNTGPVQGGTRLPKGVLPFGLTVGMDDQPGRAR